MTRYFDSVFYDGQKLGVKWSKKKDDFWAYDGFGATWSGYYSTNTELKKHIMHFSDFIQSATQIMSVYPSEKSESSLLAAQDNLIETNSIMQHAITGTQTQEVADDYKFMMKQAWETSVKKSN